LIKDHVLLARAGDINAADAELSGRLSETVIRSVLDAVPDELLETPAIKSDFAAPAAARQRYADYLVLRASSPRAFVDEAIAARARDDRTPPRRVHSRR
jgi:hypothetical protein